ncbi:CPBP family intramembrane glutamic endopeptidase [Chungangia koreensis]|uniref:CPBP family intramembrane glutamic endopeptidase n=1 Tax=Chungangia koreensis TaxID=752657 RepID=A0ABV8X5B4_9LACT
MNILFLIGPTIMIYIGLIALENVVVTFALFYGWLLLLPIIFKTKVNLKIDSRSLLAGIVTGLLSLGAIFGAVALLQDSVFDLNEVRELLATWDFTGVKVIGLVFVLIFINPFLEELYWREFMYGRLAERGFGKAIGITSFFYALYHLFTVYLIFSFPFNLIAVLPVFLSGLMWGYMRFNLKSIAAPVISHMLADLGIMMVYFSFIA